MSETGELKKWMTIETTFEPLKNVVSALEGNRGHDQERIARVGLEWLDLLLRKNADYGGSAWEIPALRPQMPVGDAILVRMSDKIARIRQLSGNTAAPLVNESFDDTIRDLGAYCLLYLARPELPF